MEKLLLEIANYLIVVVKLNKLHDKLVKALKRQDYELGIKLREELRKIEKTLPTIKKLEKLRDKLTTK